MSKTKLKKLQKLEVRLLPYLLVPLFSLLLFGIYIYCWFGCVQEERQKKLLQAKSISFFFFSGNGGRGSPPIYCWSLLKAQ